MNNSKLLALRLDKAIKHAMLASGAIYNYAVGRIYENKGDVSNAGNRVRMDTLHFGLQRMIVAGADRKLTRTTGGCKTD